MKRWVVTLGTQQHLVEAATADAARTEVVGRICERSHKVARAKKKSKDPWPHLVGHGRLTPPEPEEVTVRPFTDADRQHLDLFAATDHQKKLFP